MCCCFPTLFRYPMSYGCSPMPMMYGGMYSFSPMFNYNNCGGNPYGAMLGYGIALGVTGVAGMLINKYC